MTALSGITKYRVVDFLPKIHVHWNLNDRIWASRGHDIIMSSDSGETWMKVATIPSGRINKVLSRVDLCRRLLRLGVKTYVQVSDRDFIVFLGGEIFRWRQENNLFNRIGRVRQGSGPLQNGCCVDDKGNVYYGEYWRNPGREDTAVLTWQKETADWVPFYSFPKGAIRHIHAVQFDSITRKVWVATGDQDHESQIGYFDEECGLQRLTVIASGQQMARAVSLLFTNDYVYWGSDGNGGVGDGANYIYRWSRASKNVESVAKVKGPVYYSNKSQNGRLFVATVVEGDTSESDRSAHLWMSDDGSKWEEIGQWKKDGWPYIFGHGILSFPGGQPTERLYVTSHAMKHAFGTWVLEPNRDSSSQ